MSDSSRVRWLPVVAFATVILFARNTIAEDWPRVISNLKRTASSPQSKRDLAVAHNNYAIELSKQGDWSKAESELQRAVALDANNKKFRKNLSVIYLNHAAALRQNRRSSTRGTDVKAKALVKRALHFNPRSAEAYVVLGDIAYDNQQLKQAASAWQRAKQLDASVTRIDARLKKLNAEQSVEKKFDRAGNLNFDLRYQEGIGYSKANNLRNALDKARRDVGRDFGYWPRHPIVVLVYSEEAFRQVRQGPDWVGGVYDGKIRIPFPRSPAAQASLKSTLVHEYTHAIVHDLTRNRCPTWLNEGLAEFEEARTRKPNLRHLQAAVSQKKLIPLASLDLAFQSRNANVAALAYQQSYSLVTFLDQKYRFFRIRSVLDKLSQDVSIEDALQSELRLTPAQLEQRWQRWLPSMTRGSYASR